MTDLMLWSAGFVAFTAGAIFGAWVTMKMVLRRIGIIERAALPALKRMKHELREGGTGEIELIVGPENNEFGRVSAKLTKDGYE